MEVRLFLYTKARATDVVCQSISENQDRLTSFWSFGLGAARHPACVCERR
jgi:hypothetical protein